MARIKASIKDIKKSRKNRLRNIMVKTAVKKAIKETLAAIKNKKEAREKFKKTASVIDKAVENGILHKNTGARKKSRLMQALNRVSGK